MTILNHAGEKQKIPDKSQPEMIELGVVSTRYQTLKISECRQTFGAWRQLRLGGSAKSSRK
ncbi:hypothetical protein ZHAS_00012216 [Anopheles sinensis]|uniref:Uncharacterized protein n=1 Tax=Anopheles sinensis TaxID=74873 RepID=A0A084W283_ANOSI|nr:hypothetical protein ZHAS_00012216 [Anopheles sinensis]